MISSYVVSVFIALTIAAAAVKRKRGTYYTDKYVMCLNCENNVLST